MIRVSFFSPLQATRNNSVVDKKSFILKVFYGEESRIRVGCIIFERSEIKMYSTEENREIQLPRGPARRRGTMNLSKKNRFCIIVFARIPPGQVPGTGEISLF